MDHRAVKFGNQQSGMSLGHLKTRETTYIEKKKEEAGENLLGKKVAAPRPPQPMEDEELEIDFGTDVNADQKQLSFLGSLKQLPKKTRFEERQKEMEKPQVKDTSGPQPTDLMGYFAKKRKMN